MLFPPLLASIAVLGLRIGYVGLVTLQPNPNICSNTMFTPQKLENIANLPLPPHFPTCTCRVPCVPPSENQLNIWGTPHGVLFMFSCVLAQVHQPIWIVGAFIASKHNQVCYVGS